MKKGKLKLITATVFLSTILFSCATTSKTNKSVPEIPEPVVLQRTLKGQGQLTPAQLAGFFIKQRPDADVNEIINFAVDYVLEAKTEGLNSDVAFAQMCLETGYLRFGNLVTPDMHNYCGLGATGPEHPGEVFATRTLGIRAHIQHLQAYATKEEEKLNNDLIDPRYDWVHKTKFVEDIYGLAGTWATDKEYGNKINRILTNMEESVTNSIR